MKGDIEFNAPELKDITIPDLFLKIAQFNPDRDLVQLLYDYQGDSDTPITSERFTWSQVVQHLLNAAADLRRRASPAGEDLGPRKPGDPPVVVGILGATGYEYFVNLLACAMNRWTVLLISPKNSLEAIEHLLRVSSASFFLIDGLGRTIQDKMPELPKISTLAFSLPELYRSPDMVAPAPERLSQADLEKEFDLPFFILHSSGTTGHPKTIPWTHRFVIDNLQIYQKTHTESVGRHVYGIAPLFHALGLIVSTFFSVANGNIVLFPVSSSPRPPSARTLLACAPFIKGGIVGLPPSILEELHEMAVAWRQQKEASSINANGRHDEDPIKIITDNLWMVFYGGAPLRRDVGHALVKSGVPLCVAFGLTESLIMGRIRRLPNNEDWEYLEFHKGYNLHWLPLEGDDENSNKRELIIGPAQCTPAVINHDNPVGFATSDIFERHPKFEYLWRHHSRKGDVTVLNNGEKTDNRQLENLLLLDPNIQHVLVFGAGRPLNGVLVAPSPVFKGDVSTFLDVISATITNANNVIPAHSRLLFELVIVERPDKPFVLTDKGTVKKGIVMEMYKDDIEAAYENLEKGQGNGGWHFGGDLANVEDVRAYVREAVLDVLGKAVPSDSADLFLCGLDSLLAVRLRSAIVSLLNYGEKGASANIPRNVVYIHPSIDLLTSFIVGVISGKGEGGIAASSTEERIQASIKKFSRGFKRHIPSGHSVETDGMVVALTGSTGSLGCFLFNVFLQRDDVKHIYLLNRPSNIGQRERIAASFRERALDLNLLQAKEAEGLVTYLDVDLSRSDLALSKEDYERLRETVTHIFHCAWQLNFNLILESYEQVHVAGVRNLIDLALASPLPDPPRFVFTSTIASAMNYCGSSSEKPPIPEEPIDDPSVPLDQGYAQSKYVSERVLANAVQEAGLKATIMRVGQMCGDTKAGVWNKSEHIPILMRSSVEVGMVPVDIPDVHWLPSDIAASAILRQTLHSINPLEYFHVDNPTPTPWPAVARHIAASSPHPLQLVDYSQWLSQVSSDKWDAERVPAKRLMDFFQFGVVEGTTRLVVDRSAKVAPELVQVGEINEALIKKFIEYQFSSSSS